MIFLEVCLYLAASIILNSSNIIIFAYLCINLSYFSLFRRISNACTHIITFIHLHILLKIAGCDEASCRLIRISNLSDLQVTADEKIELYGLLFFAHPFLRVLTLVCIGRRASTAKYQEHSMLFPNDERFVIGVPFFRLICTQFREASL